MVANLVQPVGSTRGFREPLLCLVIHITVRLSTVRGAETQWRSLQYCRRPPVHPAQRAAMGTACINVARTVGNRVAWDTVLLESYAYTVHLS